MFRQKAIVNRQRRNINQIANVKTESYSQSTSQIVRSDSQVRQTDRPANTAEISTKSARQKYRQKSYDENVDKVYPANTMQLSTEFNENID